MNLPYFSYVALKIVEIIPLIQVSGFSNISNIFFKCSSIIKVDVKDNDLAIMQICFSIFKCGKLLSFTPGY